MNEITITIQLDRTQAQAFLTFMLNQYEKTMSDCWYSERYRHVAEGMRGPQVLHDHPHIAGLGRICLELRKQLNK